MRDHGLVAEVVDRGDDAADVVVSAARREEAVALMAAQMDEIRSRADDGRLPAASQPDVEAPADPDEATSRPLVSERLRQLWLVPVLLVPLLVLLGSASVPANYAVLVLIGGMVALVVLRQRRRRR